MVLAALAQSFQLMPRSILASDIVLLLMIAVLLFLVELVFFLVPGVSLSTLVIGMVAMAFGFVPVLIISLVAILAAHFLIRKDISMFLPDIFTLVPLIAFASFFGSWALGALGWGFYGVALGLIKWGVAIPTGFMLGRNMAKRYREVVLEPVVNFFVFTYLSFLFMWVL